MYLIKSFCLSSSMDLYVSRAKSFLCMSRSISRWTSSIGYLYSLRSLLCGTVWLSLFLASKCCYYLFLKLGSSHISEYWRLYPFYMASHWTCCILSNKALEKSFRLLFALDLSVDNVSNYFLGWSLYANLLSNIFYKYTFLGGGFSLKARLPIFLSSSLSYTLSPSICIVLLKSTICVRSRLLSSDIFLFV